MEKAIRRYWPIFVLPTLAAFCVGFIYPFVQGLYLSFCKFTTIKKATFNGLDKEEIGNTIKELFFIKISSSEDVMEKFL